MVRLPTTEGQPPSAAYHGFVRSSPDASGEPFTVIVPDFSEDHVFEVRYYTPPVGTLPIVGDQVLVVFDDRAEPWVVAWSPALPFSGPVVPYTIDFLGDHPKEVDALKGDLSITSYGFPGSAATASTQTLLTDVTGRVVKAIWDVAWNPKSGKNGGIRLGKFKEGEEVQQVAEITGAQTEAEGKAIGSPCHCQRVVTTDIAALWEEARTSGAGRFLCHQQKTDGVNANVLFMSRLIMALEL